MANGIPSSTSAPLSVKPTNIGPVDTAPVPLDPALPNPHEGSAYDGKARASTPTSGATGLVHTRELLRQSTGTTEQTPKKAAAPAKSALVGDALGTLDAVRKGADETNDAVRKTAAITDVIKKIDISSKVTSHGLVDGLGKGVTIANAVVNDTRAVQNFMPTLNAVKKAMATGTEADKHDARQKVASEGKAISFGTGGTVRTAQIVAKVAGASETAELLGTVAKRIAPPLAAGVAVMQGIQAYDEFHNPAVKKGKATATAIAATANAVAAVAGTVALVAGATGIGAPVAAVAGTVAVVAGAIGFAATEVSNHYDWISSHVSSAASWLGGHLSLAHAR